MRRAALNPTFMRALTRLVLSLILTGVCAQTAVSQVKDPYDPFDKTRENFSEADADQDKTAQELIEEGHYLLMDERLLDARTKLLKALKKDPKAYKAHLLLAGYYIAHVGHFRLAFKYASQARHLFEEKYGKPPYSDILIRVQHAQILYLLSQVKLNLDNYQGALDVLDEYESYKYYDSWYPGSRSWVLMKLGRLDEAIKIARLGILSGAEPGRTLNMLGILLSMKGERETSINVFKEAIGYELSLGEKNGQPATPLNNVGEVFKEIFDEDRAENSWRKATRMPDGCEHVLPSLNLALLYISQLQLQSSKKTIDNFESCVAQYPLRNGEEHRAFVHLARGRIDLLSGHIDSALEHFNQALENRQWYGKIGTNQEDLQSAVLISLAQALRASINNHRLRSYSSWADWLAAKKTIAAQSVRRWWTMRRARQILTEDLSGIEDLYIRNTDSMIEYASFGETLAGLRSSLLEKRVERETSSDNRVPAEVYYIAYLGENLLSQGSRSRGLSLIDEAIQRSRPRYDDALKAHALAVKLSYLNPKGAEYADLSKQLFLLHRPQLRNFGLRLPVTIKSNLSDAAELLEGSMFMPRGSGANAFEVEITKDSDLFRLVFNSRVGAGWKVRVKGSDLEQALNNLSDAVFSIDLK